MHVPYMPLSTHTGFVCMECVPAAPAWVCILGCGSLQAPVSLLVQNLRSLLPSARYCQVPGLPLCVQVAAGAGSLALGSCGRAFAWGGSAAVWGQQTDAGRPAGASCGHSSRVAPQPEKAPLPWLMGEDVVELSCGQRTCAVVTAAGSLMMWGERAALPSSMLDGARALAGGSMRVDDGGGEAANLHMDPERTSQHSVDPAVTTQSVSVTLSGTADGVGVHLFISPAGAAAMPTSTAAPSSCSSTSAASACNCSTGDSRTATAADNQYMNRERVTGVHAGEAHHVVLCGPSAYVPDAGDTECEAYKASACCVDVCRAPNQHAPLL